jgi:hypothetical protein
LSEESEEEPRRWSEHSDASNAGEQGIQITDYNAKMMIVYRRRQQIRQGKQPAARTASDAMSPTKGPAAKKQRRHHSEDDEDAYDYEYSHQGSMEYW